MIALEERGYKRLGRSGHRRRRIGLICVKKRGRRGHHHGTLRTSADGPMAKPIEDPWALRDADFPARSSREQQLKFLLRYAILAPSNRNTQPWQFAVGRDQITIHADASRWQRISDFHKRELYISLGCALENLLVALEHFGIGYVVTRSPGASDESIAAQIAILDRPLVSAFRTANMFKAIVRRHTHHGRYIRRAVAPGVLRKLKDCRVEHDLSLLLTSDPAIKRAVDRLMLEGDALSLSDPRYREELADCIGEGNFGGPWLLSIAQEFAIAHLGVSKAVARGDHAALMSSPVFGLISGNTGTDDARIKAGQLLERICLAATTQGLFLQPISQLLEVETVKLKFSKLFRAGGVPLMPFRLGYAASPGHRTPRRPLAEVLL
jgi:nitroreductase